MTAQPGVPGRRHPASHPSPAQPGWPSFFEPEPGAVIDKVDKSLGMARTENLCGNCGGHLGHSFPDGPKPTGIRYCINGAALKFKEGGRTS